MLATKLTSSKLQTHNFTSTSLATGRTIVSSRSEGDPDTLVEKDKKVLDICIPFVASCDARGRFIRRTARAFEAMIPAESGAKLSREHRSSVNFGGTFEHARAKEKRRRARIWCRVNEKGNADLRKEASRRTIACDISTAWLSFLLKLNTLPTSWKERKKKRRTLYVEWLPDLKKPFA